MAGHSRRATTTDYDVIVVGAGIIGSCTAYHSQSLGQKTLLLEQFRLGHTNGSSHGKSRIIRYAHDDPAYIPVVKDAYAQIAELEKKRKVALWKNCGLLWMSDGNIIERLSANLAKYQLNHEVLSGSEVCKRYPQFSFDSSWTGLVDPAGGVLYADKWLSAFQDEFLQAGGKIRDEEKVLDWVEAGDHIQVETRKGKYTAKKLVLCPGVWFSQIVRFGPGEKKNGEDDRRREASPPVHVQPTHISVCYWAPKVAEDIVHFNENNFPVLIVEGEEAGTELFALPNVDYPDSIKLANHLGGKYTPGDHIVHEGAVIDKPAAFIRRHVPMIDGEKPKRIDTCKYTMSDDEHYIIDRAPGFKHVLIGGGMSGTGFKVAPAIGRALALMALDRPAPFDLSRFSIARFSAPDAKL